MASQNIKIKLFPAMLIVLIFITGYSTAQETTEKETVSVTTSLGEIVGQQTDKIRLFAGIPYAQAPVDDLRWRVPQPFPAWDTPLIADTFGAACPQDQTSLFSTFGQMMAGDQNCLFLNIYTPPNVDSSVKLPVMVWIHGGALVIGSANQYDLSTLAAENNVVAVSMNYRLGVFGFLAHPELRDEAGESGNYGLMDQQLALQWVQDHIADFGGDPENVTIFGESAGGSSVCYQLASPTAAGLFHKAILQSAVCLYPPGYTTLSEAEQASIEYGEAVGCAEAADVAACLRNVPVRKLVSTPPTSVGLAGKNQWGVVTGHHVLPESLPAAFATGNFNRVPVINGTNLDEGTLFDVLLPTISRLPVTPEKVQQRLEDLYGEEASAILKQYPIENYESIALAASAITTDSVFACPAVDLNRSISGYTPTYAYEFRDREAPISMFFLNSFELGAYHSAEIPYVMRASLIGSPDDFTAEQDALSQAMVQYWVNFARTGNPNGGDLPEWEHFDTAQPVMIFAPGNIHLTQDFSTEHRCQLWLGEGEK